jgi:hypothetical protein
MSILGISSLIIASLLLAFAPLVETAAVLAIGRCESNSTGTAAPTCLRAHSRAIAAASIDGVISRH